MTATTKSYSRPGTRQDNTEVTSDELCQGWEGRSATEALDELAREIQVRERCFPKWIGEGRVSMSDAKDRLQRLIKAAEIVQSVLDTLVPPAETDTAVQS